jgi:transcription elongation factor GreA-like protein/transcription elongation GreA/GreB family factor
MKKGRFVFHTGGWGAGQIFDVSLLREEVSVEFENVNGRKSLSFENAFKTLIPIPDDHFLALRFSRPEVLEQKAKDNPAELIRLILRDLGPKTAAEIKDELSDIIVPGAEWSRWWQAARAKIKKDTMVETPSDLKDPFQLRQKEVSHSERLLKELENRPEINDLIQTIYLFTRDFPEILKNNELKTHLQAHLREVLSRPDLSEGQKLQLHFLLQDFSSEKQYPAIQELIKAAPSIEKLIAEIDIVVFKKRVLLEVKNCRPEWKDTFLNLLFKVEQTPLRDYLLSELTGPDSLKPLKKKLEELAAHPSRYPDLFLWYFQKAISQPSLPFGDKEGKLRFFESFLVLLADLEQLPTYRDMIKKMHSILEAGRYAIVRQMMKDATPEMTKEFLLLATKCHSLTDHDIKILHALAAVAHPELAKMKKQETDQMVIWTTDEGYKKVQHRIQQIATVETVENAKEIEVARSHGDLRENQEFKAALEKRSRLQSEMKTLSEQMNHARILSKDDISTDEVGVGAVVECKNSQGQTITYTLLGPWDADPDRGIISFQSKLAQAIKGLAIGDSFDFQGEKFTITAIHSYLK